MTTPLGAGKQSKLMAISVVPSFNYVNSKRTRVRGFTLVQTLDNAEGTAEKTTFNGQPAYLLAKTTQPTCTGDEAGWAGGVKSGTVGGEVKPTSGSSSILVEGKQLVREGDTCTMNFGNTVGKYRSVEEWQAYISQPLDLYVDDGAIKDYGSIRDTGKPLPNTGPGDYDIIDRKLNTRKWNKANIYNLSQPDGYKKYTTLGERQDFYEWFADRQRSKGSQVEWPEMAAKVVTAADLLEWVSVNDDLEDMIQTANRQIFEDVFPKLSKLDQGPILTGIDAYKWDAQALSEEQAMVQPLYDKYKGTKAMDIYEDAVRQKGWNITPDNINVDRFGGEYILEMNPFRETNLLDPSHRWSYAMKEMGYSNDQSLPEKMPKPKSKED